MSYFQLFENIAIIIAGLVSLYSIWKFIWIPLSKFINAVRIVFTNIDKISSEFLPNGGSSLRDSLDRIEARQIISEQRHKVMSTDTPYCVFEADAVGDYIGVNRTFCRWTGVSEQELLGMGWVNVIDHDWVPYVIEHWDLAIDHEREFSSNFRLIGSDGKSLPVHCTAFPLYDSKKKLSGWVGIISRIEENEVPKKPKV